jgi:hypothetical protein
MGESELLGSAYDMHSWGIGVQYAVVEALSGERTLDDPPERCD